MAAKLNMFCFVSYCVMLLLFASHKTNSQQSDTLYCICDLTVNACDINCCCDTECDDSDKLTFSTCVDQYISPDSRACVRNDLILRNNTAYQTQVTATGLFCIYKDNYEQRNYYTSPDLINSTEQVDQYVQTYSNYGYQQEVLTVYPSGQVPDYYKSGDVIYTIYESGTVGLLGLPAPVTTEICQDTNPASYLTDQNFECTRAMTSLQESCMTNLPLDAKVYYQGFKVIKSPAAFQEFPLYPNDTSTPAPGSTEAAPVFTTQITNSNTTETVSTTAAPPMAPDPLYNSTYAIVVVPAATHICIGIDGLNRSCDFSGSADLPSPTYDNVMGQCSNAVVKVDYTITQNGTDGIESVEVQFTFREVDDSMLPLTQGFQTTFQKLGESGTPLSGNPGYIVGKPVIAGNITTYNDKFGNPKVAVEVSTDLLDGITIATSDANSRCINVTDGSFSNRVAVNFGENLRSGCFVQVSYSDLASVCRLLQETSLEALKGPNPPTVVATFGNSSTEITGDWVSVQTPVEPSTSVPIGQDTCRDIVTGLHWQIIYANIGDTVNPQAKIIGVGYQYTVQDVKFQCYGMYCQPDNLQVTQPFEIVSSVEFIDASEPAVGQTAERPTISARLPEDFFYPFQ